jgi:hypothetical protein
VNGTRMLFCSRGPYAERRLLGVAVAVAVRVRVAVQVRVGVRVCVEVEVAVGVTVAVAVAVGLWVGVLVAVPVAEVVGVAVLVGGTGVAVRVAVGVPVGDIGVAVAVLVGVLVGMLVPAAKGRPVHVTPPLLVARTGAGPPAARQIAVLGQLMLFKNWVLPEDWLVQVAPQLLVARMVPP